MRTRSNRSRQKEEMSERLDHLMQEPWLLESSREEKRRRKEIETSFFRWLIMRLQLVLVRRTLPAIPVAGRCGWDRLVGTS